MNNEPQTTRTIRPGAITAGLIVVAVGVAMMIDVTGLADLRPGRLIAPLVLIALGSSIVLEKGGFVVGRRERDDAGRPHLRSRRHGGPNGGFWLIGIGVWMLVSQTHMFGLSYNTSWPLFIILAGLLMMIRGLR